MVDRVEAQTTAAVLMIRPVAFASNPQTLESNAFQVQASEDEPDIAGRARDEFDGLAGALRASGVQVHVAEGRPLGDAPDEVFPNNWVSTHADGTVVLYPLMADNRRRERRPEIFETIDSEAGFRATRVVDLTAHERRGHYLEGTGSLVLDRVNRIAYASLSPRTHLDPLGDFAQQLDYDVVTFEATDATARPIYHTNVLMSVGTRFAVICAGAIGDERKRAAVLETLRGSGREILELDLEQLHEFAGNLLELSTADGNVIALSTRAWASLDDAQRERLKGQGNLVTASIPTIERFGGGSVRCMLAEIHLPH